MNNPDNKANTVDGAEKSKKGGKKRSKSAKKQSPIFYIICFLILLPVLGITIYKAHFWLEALRTEKARQNVPYSMVDSITMDYNKPGHAITIFGNDGDIISIDELHESYVILGGLVRIEVADEFWFDLNPQDIANAEISLTPTLYREDGTISELPLISFDVDTPFAPVTLVSPSSGNETVYSSVYDVSMKVVPGSTVLINGEDVSSSIDRDGALTITVNVYPQGDNRLSLYASTKHHKDTRMDIVLYRPVMEIPLELSANTAYSSTRSLLSITGVIDPTAELVVDTAYEKDSIKVNRETGAFEFRAKFSTVGFNTVRFRAVKEGCEDSIISFRVYYLPSIAEYSRNAWIMDYAQLRLLYAQWTGRVFQCVGTVYDVFTSGDDQYVVMNVGSADDVKLVVLLNMSGTAQFDRDLQYRAYADVTGDYYYEATDYPLLTARYMDVFVPKQTKQK